MRNQCLVKIYYNDGTEEEIIVDSYSIGREDEVWMSFCIPVSGDMIYIKRSTVKRVEITKPQQHS